MTTSPSPNTTTTGTTTKIHITYHDFMPGFKKEEEIFSKEIIRGVRMIGDRPAGKNKTDEHWPRQKPVIQSVYEKFMGKITDKSGKRFNPARDNNGTPIKGTGASHSIMNITRIKRSDKSEFLYTKGTISGYDGMGDAVTFFCSKPEVWTRTLFGRKRGWDPEEEQIVSQTLGPKGDEVVYDLPFNAENLKQLFEKRENDNIGFIVKDDVTGRALEVAKDVNVYKTMELFSKGFEFLFNGDYIPAAIKAEIRARAVSEGLIPPGANVGGEAYDPTRGQGHGTKNDTNASFIG